MKKIYVLLFLLLSPLIIYYNLEINGNILVYLTNIVIFILTSFFMVYGDKYPYSLNKIFYLFSYFFFAISPIIEYRFRVNYWYGKELGASNYIEQNFLIIVIICLYQLFYYFFSKKNISNIKLKKQNFLINDKYLLLIDLIVFLIIFFRFDFEIKYLLSRSGLTIKELPQIITLIFNNFIRPIPILILILYKLSNEKKRYRIEICLIIIALLSNFPTATARFNIARLYIPLVLLYISKVRKYLNLNLLITFGLMYIFPLLHQFRDLLKLKEINFSFNFKMFTEGHFDSYQNFMRVIKADIITYGKQLLGVILFWVPRKIWNNKPIGSGAFLSEKIGLSYDNIAMNYFGEGYINFGYTGVFIFVLILAYLNSISDKKYWKYKNNIIFKCIYLIMLGMEFFILRGDLMSSIAFSVGIILSIKFLEKILLK